ncbi:MAG: peptidoglycan-associated lipoprotein Pal [Alphaproteobacteria bacterium]|nr:peptidoglycan-associated lipoprotein Pal [Alphaproteobacteria bacterium]
MLRISTSLMAVTFLLAACSSNDEYDYGADGDVGAANQSRSYDADQDGIGSDSLPANQPTPGTQEELELSVGDRVFFDYDSAVLSPVATETLDRQGAWLRQYPSLVVTIEGHADERGTREYNLAIGDRRATAVRNYLLALNVSPNQILTISYGEERPADAGSDESAWANNRRAVTVVTTVN